MPVRTSSFVLYGSSVAVTPLLVLVGTALGSWWLTGRLRGVALRRGIVDALGTRTSHQAETPRGGGLAMGLLLVGAIAWLVQVEALDRPAAIGTFGGLVIAILVGVLDDLRVILRPGVKLVAHFVAALWVLGWMSGPPALELEGFRLEPPWLRAGVAGVYVMWVVNLTNFEDGIDGFLGAQALLVGAGTALLWRMAAPDSMGWWMPALLAAAAAGFLVWNLPPAKVFAGDSGSYAVGMWFAAMSLQAAHVRPDLLWAWLILMAVFIADATVTLVRRIWLGERIFEAHRNHAYQRLARRAGSHATVTLGAAVITTFALFPVAAAVATNRLNGLVGLALVYVPLSVAVLVIGGAEE